MSDIEDEMGEPFDTNSAPPQTAFEPLPPNWYTVQIDGAEVKKTKAGTGSYLSLKLTVLDDSHANRKVFDRLTLKNPNAKAEEIGRGQLAGLGIACGLASIKDSGELQGHIIMAKVTVRKEEGRDPDNEVKAYKAQDGASNPKAGNAVAHAEAGAKAAPKAAAPASVPKAAAAPGGSKPPWMNKK